MENVGNDDIRKAVRENYGKVAQSENSGCCCSSSSCCDSGNNPTAEEISMALGYSDDDVSSVPEGANMGLGCGNPITGKRTGFSGIVPGVETGREIGDLRCCRYSGNARPNKTRHSSLRRLYSRCVVD